jgi:hypothetical protein
MDIESRITSLQMQADKLRALSNDITLYRGTATYEAAAAVAQLETAAALNEIAAALLLHGRTEH